MKKLITALTIALAIQANAYTIELDRYVDIVPLIVENTLIVTDLDNTVVESPQMLGSVQWVDYNVERLIKAGVDEKLAIEIGNTMFAEVNRVSPAKAVEVGTPGLIKVLQERATVLALTARPLTLAARTVEQLSGLGIDLAQDQLNDDLRLPKQPTDATTFLKGVVVAGTKDKGVALREVIEKHAPERYRRIIFIDDKLKYSTQVEKAFAGTGFEVITVRYSAADPNVTRFDAQVAQKQWEHFQSTATLLTDDHARELLYSRQGE